MKQLALSFILLFIFSCKKGKDPAIPLDKYTYIDNYIFDLNSNCKDSVVELTGVNTGYQFFQDSNYIRYAFFNPEDPNEILLYKEYNNQILIYNRITKERKLLINMHLLSPPKWGRNGWILLNAGMIYKIKSDGTGLTELASGYGPEWNFDGTKFAYTTFNSGVGKSIGVVYDMNTNTKDTLPFMLAAGMCWQNQKNLIIFHTNEQVSTGFNIVDMNTVTRTKIMDIESPMPPCWVSDNEFIYVAYKDDVRKIFKLNIEKNTIHILATLCANDMTGYMSYSPLTNELISVVDHWKSIGPSQVEITTKLMILNFNDKSVTYINP